MRAIPVLTTDQEACPAPQARPHAPGFLFSKRAKEGTMYGTLALTPKALDEYRPIAGEAIDEIRQLAAPLQGLRVLHLSATAVGTGVAELLNGAVPLLSDIGLACSWQGGRPAAGSAAANKAPYRHLAGA